MLGEWVINSLSVMEGGRNDSERQFLERDNKFRKTAWTRMMVTMPSCVRRSKIWKQIIIKTSFSAALERWKRMNNRRKCVQNCVKSKHLMLIEINGSSGGTNYWKRRDPWFGVNEQMKHVELNTYSWRAMFWFWNGLQQWTICIIVQQ